MRFAPLAMHVAMALTFPIVAPAHGQTSTPPPATATSSPGAVNMPAGTKDASRTFDDNRNAEYALDRTREDARAEDNAATRRYRVLPALPGDLTVDAEVRDRDGRTLGRIEAVGNYGVQLLMTGEKRVRLPAEGFGKDRKGLLVNIRKATLDTMLSTPK